MHWQEIFRDDYFLGKEPWIRFWWKLKRRRRQCLPLLLPKTETQKWKPCTPIASTGPPQEVERPGVSEVDIPSDTTLGSNTDSSRPTNKTLRTLERSLQHNYKIGPTCRTLPLSGKSQLSVIGTFQLWNRGTNYLPHYIISFHLQFQSLTGAIKPVSSHQHFQGVYTTGWLYSDPKLERGHTLGTEAQVSYGVTPLYTANFTTELLLEFTRSQRSLLAHTYPQGRIYV